MNPFMLVDARRLRGNRVTDQGMVFGVGTVVVGVSACATLQERIRAQYSYIMVHMAVSAKPDARVLTGGLSTCPSFAEHRGELSISFVRSCLPHIDQFTAYDALEPGRPWSPLAHL